MPDVLKMYPSWRLNSRIFMGLTMSLPHVQTDLGSVKRILPVFWIKVLELALHSLDYLHYDPIFEKLKTDLGNVQLSLITFLFHISVNFSSLSNHSFVDPIHIYYFRAVNKVCNFF